MVRLRPPLLVWVFQVFYMIGVFLEKIHIKVKTDSSAAKGIASRKGLGKVGHTEIN